tara:strand:+ start:751 stop:1359 length:609 start_codon:yes stop_codon:yes gene_type:complete
MWALINTDDNSIIEVIRYPKAVTINNFLHSKQIFSDLPWSELNNLGIYEVLDNGVKGNDLFEVTSNPIYTFNPDDNNVSTSYTITEKPLSDSTDSDGVITYGLKHHAKEQAKEIAHNLIRRFNWLVERSIYDSSKTIPSAVGTYVGKIKADCATIEAAIDGASNMAAFKALYQDTIDSDGNVTEVARVNRWTDNYDVKTYIR